MDTELVVRAQHGDGAAFEELAKDSVDRLHDVARSILSDARLAEDATQQALLDIWQDLPRLREPARFEAWSYRLLVHACYDEARRERRWMPNLPSLSTDTPVIPDEMAAVVDRESSSVASVASRWSSARSWSCTTAAACPSTRSPMCSASRSARCIHGSIAPCRASALHSTRIADPRLEDRSARRCRDERPS
jgi:hypothetical protein